MAPTEPEPTRWSFPAADTADPNGLVGVGADLEPGTILAAYRAGLFPMPVSPKGVVLGWWSPDRRGVLPLDGLRVSKSLRRSCRRYEVTFDTAFTEVVVACADPGRPHAWITADVQSAYERLHGLGWAHSVEARDPDDGTLAGGLYGVAIGGLFAGESMFHRGTDASKVALVALVERLTEPGAKGRLLDIQWVTPHLESLGATAIPRDRYLERLRVAIELPLPPVFA